MLSRKKTKVRNIQGNWFIIKYGYRRYSLTILGSLSLLAGTLLYEVLSSFIRKSYRRNIDKNGVLVKAVVFNKTMEYKGKTIYFKYFYKGIEYKNYEHEKHLYDSLDYGQMVILKIDSLDPEEYYIFR